MRSARTVAAAVKRSARSLWSEGCPDGLSLIGEVTVVEDRPRGLESFRDEVAVVEGCPDGLSLIGEVAVVEDRPSRSRVVPR